MTPLVVGLLYPGEMGAALARRLGGAGWRVVTCLEGRGAATRARAVEAGIEPLASLPAVAAAADVVVSLVPPGAAAEAAAAFAAAAASAAAARPVYLDANSVSPLVATAVAGVVRGAGCEAVDGAFVGGAAGLGPDPAPPAATVLYLSGPAAATLGELLGEALPVRVVGVEVGRASAFKLAFAGFNKGLVALLLEAAAAGELAGLHAELLERLRAFYPGAVATVERLLPSYPRHAARRAVEMSEEAAWLAAAGQEAPMAAATQAVLERLAALDLATEGVTAADVLEECRRQGLLATGQAGDR